MMLRKTALLISVAAIGYDWKMDGDKLSVDGDGNPVWVDGDKELSVRGDTITRTNSQAKEYRTRAEKAEADLAKFQGIDDPEAARTALQQVKDMKDGDLIAKGKLDEVKNQITQQYEAKLTDATKRADTLENRLNGVTLDNAFAQSEFVAQRIAVPTEMLQATFRDRFKVVEGKVVAVGSDGLPLRSNKNIGEDADFDESLEILIGGFKHKDAILKAPEAAGSGSNGAGGSRGRGRTITRTDFEALAPTQQQEVAAKAGTGEMTIVD